MISVISEIRSLFDSPVGAALFILSDNFIFTNNELPELPEMISVISEIRSLFESSVGTTLW